MFHISQVLLATETAHQVQIASKKNEPPINILDRNKTQLAADQNADLTLDRVRQGRLKKHQRNLMAIFSEAES